MQQWLNDHVARIRATIASGDVRTVERRYMPATLGVGVLFGLILGYLSNLLAVLVFMIAGFLIGYAVRSYISHVRRMRFIREQM